MGNYGLIGHPLGHTMSPFIHKKLFEASGKSGEYSVMDIAPEELSSKIPELKKLNGFNITIPHKVSIIEFTDSLDESAERYNSVNCIHSENGRLRGYNTDCDGFLRSVDNDALGGKVLLLGCGGVGRMMAIEAVRHGGELTVAIIPEAMDMAKALAGEISEKYPDSKVKTVFTKDVSGSFDLLVNATPVGMYPKCDACAVSEEAVAGCRAVFDAVYNPGKTKLMRLAEAHGIPAVGGMSMLVYQAAVAHEIWYGGSFSGEQIDSIIRDASEALERNFK